MANKLLNFPWAAVNNRVAKVGVGAYLTASAETPVTTAYTRLLGTFSNVELEGFEVDGVSGKLMYNPTDELDRTFNLNFSGNASCPNLNDVITVGIEVTHDSIPEIVTGTEVSLVCRETNSPYPFSRVFPLSLSVGDLIEIQIKGDASFTATMNEFTTTLTKFY